MNKTTVTFDPAQWQLVPVEPTAEMAGTVDCFVNHPEDAAAIYRVMLAAAPSPVQVKREFTDEEVLDACRAFNQCKWESGSGFEKNGFISMRAALESLGITQAEERK